MAGNIKILGKCASRYSAEVEYFDLSDCKKRVKRLQLKDKTDIDEFRDMYSKSAMIGVLGEPEVVVAIRILKGDEIIFDRYCQFCELSYLTALSEKMKSIKEK